MTKEKTYFRPDDLKTALALLQRPDMHAVPLAGGSWLVPHLRTDVDLPGSLAAEVDAVVDLADLGLNAVRLEGSPGSGWLHLGATALLADLVDGEACQAIAGGLLAEAARREGPVNLRNVATVAGSVLAAESSSELLLALLVLAADAIVVDGDGEERTVPLADLLADRPALLGRGLITELRLPWPKAASAAAWRAWRAPLPTTRSWPPRPWSTAAAARRHRRCNTAAGSGAARRWRRSGADDRFGSARAGPRLRFPRQLRIPPGDGAHPGASGRRAGTHLAANSQQESRTFVRQPWCKPELGRLRDECDHPQRHTAN